MSYDPYRDAVKRGNLRPEYAQRECYSLTRFTVRLIVASALGVLILAGIIEAVSLVHRALT